MATRARARLAPFIASLNIVVVEQRDDLRDDTGAMPVIKAIRGTGYQLRVPLVVAQTFLPN